MNQIAPIHSETVQCAPVTIESLITQMKGCEQTSGMNMLQHGVSVQYRYADLVTWLRTGAPRKLRWRLPDWLLDEAFDTIIKDNLLLDEIMAHYQLFHDCGKPAVLTVIDGVRRFPGHAQASERLYLEAEAARKSPSSSASIWRSTCLKMLACPPSPRVRKRSHCC